MARAIAGEIQARVTTEEAGRLSRNHKIVPAALDAYLLGRYYWDQFTEESILKAIDHFEQAIQLDPAYAAAYGGLAECWTGFLFTDARPWAETISKAREAATKALALDDTLAESHQAMAVVYYQEWNWKGVERRSRKRSRSTRASRPPICCTAICCAIWAAPTIASRKPNSLWKRIRSPC